jgi:hypothetical protein
MMEAEEISETLVFNSTLARLITRENFSTSKRKLGKTADRKAS